MILFLSLCYNVTFRIKRRICHLFFVVAVAVAASVVDRSIANMLPYVNYNVAIQCARASHGGGGGGNAYAHTIMHQMKQ